MSAISVKVFDQSSPFTKESLAEGGAFLVNKPIDWTSFDVVNKIRSTLRGSLGVRKIKVGHAGTLDPKADGLLIICFGRATKRITEFQDMGKEYTGEMFLGATTPSYDRESEIDQTFQSDHISNETIHELTQQFTGKIQQYPPAFSAIKKDGVRLYKLARAGEEVDLPLREVVIDEFRITDISKPLISFLVRCQKGTYIRSLVHDFGKELGSGAYLYSLRRTAIGRYREDAAWDIDAVCEQITNIS